MPVSSWGLVSAAAHQHLIVVRAGRVVRAQQGGSVWRWPGDTVTLVDTSIQRLQFRADQVTRERVGVQVTGLAVFRVVAPLVAYRMLDFAEPTRHHAILEQMFVGATRRLVATLSLDDCLTRRKDALAAELMAEVAPVVSGRGAPGDETDRGWGIALDTIEVQDVRVQSEEVFERLQAPYRAQLALTAVAAESEVAGARARAEAEAELASETRRATLLAREEARVAAVRERERQDAEHRATLAQLAREAAAAEARHEAERTRILAEAEAEATRVRRHALDEVSDARLQELFLTQTAPELAKALRGAFGEIVVRPEELGAVARVVSGWLATTGGR